MEARDKAKELMGKMTMRNNGFDRNQQRHCAEVCALEIISDLKSYRLKSYFTVEQQVEASKYWEDVIIELEKL